MMSDKQRKMVAMAESIAKDKAKMDELVLKQKLEKERRRAVFNAIEKLIDPVDDTELLKQLPLVDKSTWMEIVEERFISKLCGFPTCSKNIDAKFKYQKYRIDRKTKKIYENSTDRQKFCSEKCFELSIGVRAQLADQPLWITGKPLEKKYDLGAQQKEGRVWNVDDMIVGSTVPIIKQLGDLKIAESAETDDEDSNKIDAKEVAEFLSIKPSGSTAFTSPPKKPEHCPTKQSTPENALERLRTKYGKDGKQNLVRKPVMVDPKPIDLEHNKKVSENCYGEFEKILKEWITPATLDYLRTRGNLQGDISDDSDDDPLTEVQQIMQKFYAGDIPVEKRKQKIKDDKAAAKLRMPTVDSFDQHTRRIELVMNILKAGWKNLSDHLDSQESIQVTKPLIATFGLTASNLDLDKFERRICTALLFRMVSYCNDIMEENYFPISGPDSRFLAYLETIECEKPVYDRLEKFIFDQL